MSQSPAPPMPPPPSSSSPAKKPVWKRWWFWVAAVIVVLIIGAVAGGSTETPESAAPSESETTTPSSPSDTSEPTQSESESDAPTPEPTESGQTFDDGTWVIGEDIKAGTYRAADPGGGCYWERLKGFSGALKDIIANGNTSGGPIVVTIDKKDEGFSTDGCGSWSDDVKTPVTKSRNQFGDGYFIVGVDIAPGTYRVDAKANCYWERLRNFSGQTSGIITNDLPHGQTIVEIATTDAGFNSSGCGDWEKV
jgi:hypothetical protein